MSLVSIETLLHINVDLSSSIKDGIGTLEFESFDASTLANNNQMSTV